LGKKKSGGAGNKKKKGNYAGKWRGVIKNAGKKESVNLPLVEKGCRKKKKGGIS